MPLIEIVEYRLEWAAMFEELRHKLWPHFEDISTAIEHVGSTAVPGLPAKPAIDMDLVVCRPSELDEATKRLLALGYTHRAHLSMEDRRAFKRSGATHNLYVCLSNGVSLLNHLAFRDHLRTHPADAAEYATLKKELARNFPNDKCRYIEGKTAFVLSVLERCGISKSTLEQICESNSGLYRGLRREQEDPS